jgi:hypothetical protein
MILGWVIVHLLVDKLIKANVALEEKIEQYERESKQDEFLD